MPLTRRDLLAAASLGACSAPLDALARPPGAVVTPEQFGARGDGRTNDTTAFAAMAAHVQRAGGGEIVLRKSATYVVGQQRAMSGRETGYSFEPAKIMEFAGLRGALTIRGNGAKLKCAAGLRFGTFAPGSGQPTRHPVPYIQGGELSTPYRAMIKVEDCSGPVSISDLELDGNLAALRIGGPYGDTGWQIPAVGIFLVNNRGTEVVDQVYSHHHALDGIVIDGINRPRGQANSQLTNVRCEYNGRQGCSIVGGRGYDFTSCHFNHTGRSVVASNPGAGVDIEAEGGKIIRAISFRDCEFSDNYGAGVVADSGDSADLRFTLCKFVGTSNWAAWPNKPLSRFDRCLFVGPIVHAFGDSDPARAAQFYDCTFRDDPKLSPTGKVYGGENPDRPIADLPGNLNVLFSRCRFLLTHNAVLPWSTNAVIYSNCMMVQKSRTSSFPRGTYRGTNSLVGVAGLYSSIVQGELVFNGKRLPKGPLL